MGEVYPRRAARHITCRRHISLSPEGENICYSPDDTANDAIYRKRYARTHSVLYHAPSVHITSPLANLLPHRTSSTTPWSPLSRLRARSPRGKTTVSCFLTLSVSLRYPKGKVKIRVLRSARGLTIPHRLRRSSLYTREPNFATLRYSRLRTRSPRGLRVHRTLIQHPRFRYATQNVSPGVDRESPLPEYKNLK